MVEFPAAMESGYGTRRTDFFLDGAGESTGKKDSVTFLTYFININSTIGSKKKFESIKKISSFCKKIEFPNILFLT